MSTATLSPWRRVTGDWLILVWLAALVALPYAMSLYPRSDAQAAAGLLFGLLIIAEWAVMPPNSLPRDGGQAPSGRRLSKSPKLNLALMILISFFDVVYFVPHIHARVRAVAGVAARSPVEVSLQNIIENIQTRNGRLESLAALVQSGAITPQDLRPVGMLVTPDPSGLEKIKHAVATDDQRALSNAVSRYSIFRYLPGKAAGIGGAAPVPLVISKELRDLEFGWVRFLGFSDGEVVEVVASPWSCIGSGPIIDILRRGSREQ